MWEKKVFGFFKHPLSLQYQRFSPLGGQNIGIRKSEFVRKTQFLSFFISLKFTNLQSSLIKIESIERFKVTAGKISILIHNNTLPSFVWSSIALNTHVFYFENWLFSFVVSLQKWLMSFNCFRNDGEMKVSKVHRTCHSLNKG